MRSLRSALVVTTLLVIATFGWWQPAQAASTTFTVECTSQGYACIPAHLGYTGASTWGSAQGANHNCTSLTSWVLQQSGMASPPWYPMGDGSRWDDNARSAGYPVDQRPAVGAIAQWNNGSSYAPGGHVAVVVAVTGDTITFIDDSYSAHRTQRVTVGSGSAKWPSNFIHVNDAGVAALLGSATPVTIPLHGDFDGDGDTDVFWYGVGAADDALWLLEDGAVASKPTIAAVNGVYQPIVLDTTGDGTDDIFWYAPGPVGDSIWAFAAGGTFTSHETSISGTYQPVVGRFDDGPTEDVFWYAPGAAQDHVWTSDGDATFTSSDVRITGTYEALVGDFDGDDRDDVFWYAPGGAPDYLWASQGDGTFVGRDRPISGDYDPVVGDFDDDGALDLFWYGPGAHPDFVWFGAGDGTFAGTEVRVSGRYLPVAGDFAGDGGTDVLWHGAGSDYDALWTWNGTKFVGSDLTVGETVAGVAGDYGGSAHDDVFFAGPSPVVWTANGAGAFTASTFAG